MSRSCSYPRERASLVLGLIAAASLSLNAARPAMARPLGEVTIPDPAGDAAERSRKAAIRYQLGANAFRNARYREAVTHFLAADALLPSAALSYNAALAYDKLMETGRALALYRDYLRRDPDGESADEVTARIRELELRLMRQGLQQLTVLSEPPGAIVRIEDEPVGRTPWTGELEPGEHRLSLVSKGYQESTRTILLPAANAVDVRFQLEPELAPEHDVSKAAVAVPPSVAAPESAARRALVREPVAPHEPPAERDSGGSKLVPWLTVGVGAAALAASGTFELLRRQSESEARSALTPEQREKRENQASTYRTTSLVLLGTGGGLVFTGSMLLLVGSNKSSGPSANVDRTKPRKTAFDAALGCSAEGCFGSYAGRF